MENYFRGTKETPHHISVGAVLINKKNEVACHYYEEQKIRKYPPNFYTLMHESIETNETLEQTLARGLQEEFSMKGSLERYVGSLVVGYSIQDIHVEKTVLYFLCKLASIDEVRDLTDPETVGVIKWMNIDELIDIMKKQGEAYGSSSDEFKILEDVKKYYLN